MRLIGILALVASATACVPTSRWDTKLAEGFAPAGRTVSVLGVYKDGEMSETAWDVLRERIQPDLGGRTCPIAARDLSTTPPEAALFDAIGDYARTNGPTDDLLAQVAGAAQGDLILVLVEAGRLPAPPPKVTVIDPPPGQGGNATPNGKPGRFSEYRRDNGSKARADLLELSASLYSVAQRRTVAVLDLQYSGDSVDEAIGGFATRLGQMLPAATCAGWNWQSVAPETIRGLASE